ncbi:Bacteriophage-related protein OS=Bosea thiooxidans OX=53254 GN=SAMN05660750_03388 PE=4 SV=1 [Bosea thiooxidans]|uniref:Bacteriophage-related protein n=1 Tax=Bosea thiooxidans TaxID=53254 RepID=A0A1T5FNE0_9HYPH|nr:DUF2924 domain-containing protein [Bosea thiooxidans]SKB97607.1 Protein of unknown function [Bosea thiooxidans]
MVKTVQSEGAIASGGIDAELAALGPDGLRAAWRRTVGKPIPGHMPNSLLLRILAYQQQAKRQGDLSRRSQRLLDQQAKAGKGEDRSGAGATAAASVAAQRVLKPGTLLVREHDGVMHQVTVMADGFAWRGESYASLSRVALAITGTRWNGPRFFGLDRAGRS